MKIEQGIIKKARSLYKPEFQFLQSANLIRVNPDSRNKIVGGLECYASFKVRPGLITSEPYSHLSCPERDICLAQFAYAAYAQALLEKEIQVEQTVEEFLSQPGNTTFIREVKAKNRFAINTSGEILGKIALESYRDSGESILVQTNYNFENSDATFKRRTSSGSLLFIVLKHIPHE